MNPSRLQSLHEESRSLNALCTAFRDADYSLESAHRRVGLDRDPRHVLTHSGLYSFAFAGNLARSYDVTDVLLALFWLNSDVARDQYEAVVPQPFRELCRTLELARNDGQAVRPCVSVLELNGSFLLSDPLFWNRGGSSLEANVRGDLVMPMSASSLELLDRAAPAGGCEALLDIGCGSGALALTRATDYEHVVGIDVNPRAVAFARANAAMNGADVTFSLGNVESYEAETPFCHALFNAPCDLTDDDVSRPFTAIAKILSDRIDAFVAPGGIVQVHCVVPVPVGDASVEETVTRAFGHACETRVEAIPDSPLALDEDSIARQVVPRQSFLVREPRDSPALLERLGRGGIREVVPAVITLRRRRVT